MLDFRDKKEARTMGPLRKNKKSPINSKAEGKKKGWPGEVKVQKTNKFEGAMKKRVPEGDGH